MCVFVFVFVIVFVFVAPRKACLRAIGRSEFIIVSSKSSRLPQKSICVFTLYLCLCESMSNVYYYNIFSCADELTVPPVCAMLQLVMFAKWTRARTYLPYVAGGSLGIFSIQLIVAFR